MADDKTIDPVEGDSDDKIREFEARVLAENPNFFAELADIPGGLSTQQKDRLLRGMMDAEKDRNERLLFPKNTEA